MDPALTVSLAITVSCFTAIWLINVMTKDAGVIDYYWGPGFAVIAAVHVYIGGIKTLFEWMLMAAVTIWALRLATHLIIRHHKSSAEDGRYLEMRESGGKNFWWSSLFKVFILQAVLLWLIAAPLHVAFDAAAQTNLVLFALGMIIFAAGFIFEWVADHQLVSGKRSMIEAGREAPIFTGGLWGRSRHPNYFGELLVWWGVGLSAFAMSGSLLAFAGPALLTIVMRYVSIPLTEQHMIRTRPSYEEYMRLVPMIVPTGSQGRPFSGGTSKQAAE